jgi:DNA-binding NarL/FixJ family response regulator
MKINIGIADDHQLFVKSLNILIDSYSSFHVVLDAINGDDLLKKLSKAKTLPDVLLMDVNMPVLDGAKAATIIAQKYPTIKMVALSMKDDDTSILSMVKGGCCAYLLKDIHPDELEKALHEIHAKGYYNSDAYNINYRRLIIHAGREKDVLLNEREKVFLQLASSDLTYRQIAAEMHLSERTIDGYRDAIFEKLNVQSRVGMVMEGIRRGMVRV